MADGFPTADGFATADGLLLGVDGGGTATVAWLAAVNDPDVPLGRGAAGPSNPRAGAIDSACAAIDAAVDAAFAHARRARGPAAAACLAVAGAGREASRAALERWAASRRIAPPSRLRVTHDGEAVLAGAGAASGIALVAGTGSLAWGRGADGRVARVGGWGPLLGDEGSGYAIGAAGLRAAARAADGRGPDTVLLARLLERLDARDPRDLVEAVGASSRDVAELALVVIAAAAAGDTVAQGILATAAADLAEMAAALHARLDLPPRGFTLALAGGVLAGSAPLCEAMLQEVRDRGLAPAPDLVLDPVAGAARLARLLIGKTA